MNLSACKHTHSSFWQMEWKLHLFKVVSSQGDGVLPETSVALASVERRRRVTDGSVSTGSVFTSVIDDAADNVCETEGGDS